MARNIITGIDIGSSTIRIIVAEQKKNNAGFHIISAIHKESKGIKKGYIINFEEAVENVQETVRLAEKTAGVAVTHAYVGVSGISLGSIRSRGMVMVSRANAEVSNHDVKRAIAQSEANLPNLANRHIIHAIPIGFKIDDNIVLGNPAGMKGTKLEVETLFITCLSQHISDLLRVIDEAGITVDDIVASPLAASFVVLNKKQKEAGCVLVNIGSSTVSILIFEDNIPLSMEVFPIGSTHITHDIALGLQIPIEEAEKLKVEYGSDNVFKKKLTDIINARLSDIFELVEKHLKKINKNRILPAGVILAGGGSNLIGIESAAKSFLKIPAQTGVYNTNKTGNDIVITGNQKDQLLKDPSWVVALGLCAFGAKETLGQGIGIDRTDKPKNIFLRNLKRWVKPLLP